MSVLLLPPKAFYNILVNILSLYGTILFNLGLLAFSAKVDITNPNIVRLLLIAHPSFIRSPYASVLDSFSLPAKSTKLITDNFSIFFLPNVSLILNSIVMTVWALLDD